MPQPLDYAPPPRRRQYWRRIIPFWPWILMGLFIPALLVGNWIGWPWWFEHCRQRQQALDDGMLRAAAAGDLPTMQKLLAKGANIDASRPRRTTPLLQAADNGHGLIVEWLLQRGADPSGADGSGDTPLLLAAIRGDRQIVNLLLDHGADPNVASHISHGSAMTPLGAALDNTDLDMVKRLLAKGARKFPVNASWLPRTISPDRPGELRCAIELGADVDAASDGERPLHHAIRCGNREALDLLLANRANVDTKDSHGWTPLDLAAWQHRKDMADALIAHGAQPTIWSAVAFDDLAHVQQLLRDRPHLLHAKVASKGLIDFAASNARREIFDALLAQGAPWSPELLHAAAQGGDCAIIELLLARGIDVNARDPSGQIPLHGAAARGQLPAAKLLLARGADLQATDDRKTPGTPLCEAANANHLEVAELLLKRGATIGPTLLHEVVQRGHLEMVKLLVTSGADVNIQDATNQTPLYIAKGWRMKEIAQFLIEHGADPSILPVYPR